MLADIDVIVVDEFGIGRKLKAGQPVPASLVDAYNAEVEHEADDEAKAKPKPQRHAPKRRK